MTPAENVGAAARPPRPSGLPAACLALLFVAACGPDEAAQPNADESGTPETIPWAEANRDRVFDRELAFISDAGDPLILVPWFFRTHAEVPNARHEVRVWVAGAGGWEALAHDTMELPVTRTPWRVLPSRRIRLVVGEAERLEAVIFRDPARELETRPRDFVTEWTPSQGESIRLFRGQSVLGSGVVDGFVLDLSRSWETSGDRPGDWVFLHAGDDLQFFMDETESAEGSRTSAPYRGWSRVDFRDAQWPEVEVTWENLRSFERARRDIPGGWSFATPGEQVVGRLRVVSTHLTAEAGEGPLLPVTGLFEVEGTLRVEGREFDVVGLVRHVQY